MLKDNHIEPCPVTDEMIEAGEVEYYFALSNKTDAPVAVRAILEASLAARPSLEEWHPSDEQIKHMVERFLWWRLPENFSPDAGISFKPTFNDHLPTGPMMHNPTGTNLFDYTQAEAMVRHMIALPKALEK